MNFSLGGDVLIGVVGTEVISRARFTQIWGAQDTYLKIEGAERPTSPTSAPKPAAT